MIAKKKKNRKSFWTFRKKTVLLAIFLVPLTIYFIDTNLKLNTERQKLLNNLADVKQTSNSYSEKEKRLNSLLTEAASPASLEKVAREELNLQKPGEQILMIKKDESTQGQDQGAQEQNKGLFGNIINWIKNQFSAKSGN
jgi:cell division protein FtsB